MPEMLRLTEGGPPVAAWLCQPLGSDLKRTLARVAALPDMRWLAVMPDVHQAESFCVGLVAATSELVYPHAVGGDIGCGMLAQRFECDAQPLEDHRLRRVVLSEVARGVPIVRHRRDLEPSDRALGPDPSTLSSTRLVTIACRDGPIELGTLGRGNHFAELQIDAEGDLWIMVHSGSRGLGQAVFNAHTRASPGNMPGAIATEVSIRADSPEGAAYLTDADWCVRYASANRAAIADAIGRVLATRLGGTPDMASRVDVPHNFVRREMHGGVELLVHRKGAALAHADQPGLIPGSMGTPSFHVRGRGCPESLCSSSHGAGRAMSRGEAFRRITQREFARQTMGVTVDSRQAERLRDEAPGVYKDIRSVMRAQRDLVAITRELRPILTLKGT